MKKERKKGGSRKDPLISLQVIEPLRASVELASLAHDAQYVERFYAGETSKEEQRRTGFEWTHGLASRVRYETGA